MSNRRAFTLVEITVAMAVTLVLATLMLNVLTQSNVIWNRSNESLDTFREARGALQLMSREIGQLRSMPEPQQTFPLLALEHHPDTEPEEQNRNEEIYALVNTPNSGRANWCAVGYYCEWNERNKAYSLKRQSANSDETYKSMALVFSATAPLTGTAGFKELYSRSRASASDVAATYLWDLHFKLPDNIQVSDPLQQSHWPYGEFSQKLPPWIEVRCKVLGSLAARRLAASNIEKTDWFEPQSDKYRRLVLPYEQQFVTRISLAQ